MLEFGTGFAHKSTVPPKVMHFGFFEEAGFEFQNHLECQRLKQFLMLRYSCFEVMIKVFYSNLRITDDDILCSEVNRKRIIIQPPDWLSLVKFNYQGLQLNGATPIEHLNYDYDMTLAGMLRLRMEAHNLKNVDVLSMNDKLLYYTFVHILCHRHNNYLNCNTKIFSRYG